MTRSAIHAAIDAFVSGLSATARRDADVRASKVRAGVEV